MQKRWIRRVCKSKSLLIGGVVVLAAVMIAILAPWISPYDPRDMGSDRFSSFSTTHFFGTDRFGRDVFSRILWGSRISLLVGMLAALGGGVVGGLVGLISGYAGGAVDTVIMRIIEIFLALPLIVLALLLVAFLGSSALNVAIAVGITVAPKMARWARAEALRFKQLDHVLAARAIAASPVRILIWHVLPLAFPSILILCTLTIGSTILIESSLSFLGLGVEQSIPTWGGMLSDGRALLLTRPALTLLPGLAIVVTVLGFNIFGDGLNDLLSRRSQIKL